MTRIKAASCVGTTIEFYDFFIYGTAAALVFPQVFFPALGGAAGTVASFATYAVAFVARPMGSVVFGHFGDRYGPRPALVATLLTMGLATFAIGVLPGATVLGVAAPIILVVLRFVQGLAVGGEWAGAVLLATGAAPAGSRGWAAVFPQLGPPLAFGLANLSFLGLLQVSWRIPFLLSIVLVGVGLYVRHGLPSTDLPGGERRRSPLREVFAGQPRQVILGGLAQTMPFAFFFTGTAFLTGYGTRAGLERPVVLGIGAGVALLFGGVVALAGAWSDRVGRRRPIVVACVLALLWAPVLFPVIDLGGPVAFAAGLAVTLSIFGLAYGPVGSYLPELFRPGHRYTGAGVAYNLGAVVGGAIPALAAPALAAAHGGEAVGGMLALTALISLACLLALPSYAPEPAIRSEARSAIA
ncbi:MFS transporter [Actinoplanes sp. NPDC048796]|uniref:MFS transporter n=1 Tax=Actinoplanes sp. NPDC048796 TaxID=3155640 RepID=UPI0033DAF270